MKKTNTDGAHLSVLITAPSLHVWRNVRLMNVPRERQKRLESKSNLIIRYSQQHILNRRQGARNKSEPAPSTETIAKVLVEIEDFVVNLGFSIWSGTIDNRTDNRDDIVQPP